MLTIRTQIAIPGITGIEVFDFLLNCSAADYLRWRPSTHVLVSHDRAYSRRSWRLVILDEVIGNKRVRVRVVTRAEWGKRLIWQLRKRIRLPAWLSLEFDEQGGALQTDAHD